MLTEKCIYKYIYLFYPAGLRRAHSSGRTVVERGTSSGTNTQLDH